MKQLYKVDENGNVRVWWMEINPDDKSQFRAVSGVLNGKLVYSGWKAAKPKNVGKVNATTAEQQAVLEVERKELDQTETGGYYETIEEAHTKVVQYFDCMLAHKWNDEKHRVDWNNLWSQPKLDGIRCLAKSEDLKSRNGKPLVSTPHILEEIQKLCTMTNYNVVFDGELYNHALKHDFEKIVSLVRKTKPKDEDIVETREKVHFHVYDIFIHDRPELNFSERASILNELITKLGPDSPIKFVAASKVTDQEQLDELYGLYLEAGYEGQMVRIDAPYEQKRSRNLLKRKEFEDAEFIIDHVEEGVGNWAGAVKRVYIKLENGDIQKSGVRGTYEVLEQYLKEADTFPGTEVTIRFQGRTSDGKLRFPVVIHFWRGKRDL